MIYKQLKQYFDWMIFMSKFRLTDGYKFSGFKTMQTILSCDSKLNARIIQLKRVHKKHYAPLAVKCTEHTTTNELDLLETFRAVISKYI